MRRLRRVQFANMDGRGETFQPANVAFEPIARIVVDDRPDIGANISGIANAQGLHGAAQHRRHPIGDVLLHEQHP